MDPLLYKAARDGNIEAFLELLDSDPLILERVATTTADNPLHMASMLGQLDFVKELLKHKSNVREYAKELNQQGYSPLHLAAANGHFHVVEMLLGVSHELCLVKGRAGVTPLHCASVKGRAQIISLLLSACPPCVEEVNAWNETAIHVAVKNNQFESVEALVEGMKQSNNLVVLNRRDVEGNTLLHLAAARKNHQAVELLVKCININDGVGGMLEVNSRNNSGLTALDLFIVCPYECEPGSGTETMRLMGRLGAARGQDSLTIPAPAAAPIVNPNSTNAGNGDVSLLRREEIISWESYFKFQLNRDNPSSVRNALLVVAVLMATATYTAALTPPMKASNSFSIAWFMIANSLGFFVSLNMIDVLTYDFPLKFELLVTMFAMVVTYDCGMIAQAPHGLINLIFVWCSVLMPLSIAILRYIKEKIKQHRLNSDAYTRHLSP